MIGGYSYGITLPINWIKENNVKMVKVTKNKDRTLTIEAKK